MSACPGTACPHYIGQGCRVQCSETDGPPIPAQVTEPDDYERLARAYSRTNGVDHPPGILPPGYNGIGG